MCNVREQCLAQSKRPINVSSYEDVIIIAVIVLFISGSSLHFLFVEDFQLFFQYSPELLYIFTVITLNCLLGRLFIPTILSFSSGVLFYFWRGRQGTYSSVTLLFFFSNVFGRLVTFVNCGEVTFCRR